jgi:light-regulated signal transduction histidine kinase (bacteriophytochrome)
LPAIYGDSGQISRIFQNIIGNAVKFKGAADPVIEISASHEGNENIFCVKDNGLGIEPQYYDKVFAIFQRLHSRREYPGTGIGLSICKKITERHGGRIWIESEYGKGSKFFFTIPDRRLR